MRATLAEIEHLLARRRMIAVREHRHLRRSLYHLCDREILVPIYPGVFVRRDDRNDTDLRILAATRWQPDAVLVGRAAARMTFWRDLPVPHLTLAVPRHQRSRPGLTCVRRRIPSQWVCHFRDAAVTRPALTVLDLIPELAGSALSEGLRRGITLDDLARAHADLPGRRGQRMRRQLLTAYRGEPWSEAEQALHVHLRAARLTGWLTNYRFVMDGRVRYVDVVFEEHRIAIEVDGFAFHAGSAENRQRFEDDRAVGNWLTVHGWVVLRFTWRQIAETPEEVIATIRAAIRRVRVDDRATRRARRSA